MCVRYTFILIDGSIFSACLHFYVGASYAPDTVHQRSDPRMLRPVLAVPSFLGFTVGEKWCLLAIDL